MSEFAADASLVHFARTLRHQGVRIGAGQIISFCRAAATLDAGVIDDLYWAGRLTLVNRASDLHRYEAAFRAFFEGNEEQSTQRILPVARADGGSDPSTPTIERSARNREVMVVDLGDSDEPTGTGRKASDAEQLRVKRFDEWSDDELSRLHLVVPRVAALFPKRLSRRMRAARRGKKIDVRRTVRASLRYEGELIRLLVRDRQEQPRHLVMLLDVSGSMAGFSRALVQFGYSTTRASRRVEVFCFGTRLTRVTEELRHHDPDAALGRAMASVVDWDGGTRIGESLMSYVQRWGQHQFNRGSVVIICSDGLERGDPDRLAKAIERLSRQVHAIVWVNPLKGDPTFEPLARGLVAALPHIDALVAGHNVLGLESLLDVLADVA
jgi:uncharacterized protein with von Willebrand factor type A (vWA) domain